MRYVLPYSCNDECLSMDAVLLLLLSITVISSASPRLQKAAVVPLASL